LKKVVFVQHSSSIGGASWCLYEILLNLDRSIVEPHVVLYKNGPLHKKISDLGIPVTILSNLEIFPVYERKGAILGIARFLRFLFFYRLSYKAFFDYCSKTCPDTVYLNSSGILSLAWPAKASGVNTVLLHNREHWEPHGIMRFKTPLKNWFVKHFVTKLFHITEAGIKQFGDFNISIVVRDWPSFDDKTNLNVREFIGLDSSKSIILVPGGMQSIKGSKDVLEALSKMKLSHNVVVIVLGCKPIKLSWWKSILKFLLNRGIYEDRIARMSKIDKRIYLLPPTQKMKAFIQSSCVVVCPFRIPHASKAALEAQYLNRPVILYDNVEASEYVLDGKTGIITPTGDILKLANSLDKYVASDGAFNNNLGSDFVQSKFHKSDSLKILNKYFQNS